MAPSVRVDYCRFAAWGYKKPSLIWGKVQGLADVICSPATCPNMTLQEEPDGALCHRHRVKLEGSIVPLREKYRIHLHLIAYLMQWMGPPTLRLLEREVAQYLLTKPSRRHQQNHPRRRASLRAHTVTNSTSSTTITPNKVLQPRHLMPVPQLTPLCCRKAPEDSGDMQLVL